MKLSERKRKRSDSVLWQKPLHQQKCQKGKVTTQTTPQKSSIKQRLRTDLGRSVGVTTATQLVWLTGLRAHLPTNRNSRLIKRTHKKITKGKTPPSIGHSCVPMNTTLFNILWFSCQGTSRDIVYQTLVLIFVVSIRPARTLWNSTHSLLSPFTLDWSRNLLHNPMQNMAVNNISYIIYPLSTRIEKGYTNKMIPFFFCSVYNLSYPMCTHSVISFIYSG